MTSKLRDELKDTFFALVEYGANNPDMANDVLRIVALNYLEDSIDAVIEALPEPRIYTHSTLKKNTYKKQVISILEEAKSK